MFDGAQHAGAPIHKFAYVQLPLLRLRNEHCVRVGDIMDSGDIGWLDSVLGLISWLLASFAAGVARGWRHLVEVQARHPQLLSFQTLFGLVGTVLGVWKWWESRETHLFKRFEQMIEGQEVQLVKARADLLEVMNRPGPGLLIKPPLFADRPLRAVLSRKKWYRAFVSFALAGRVDRRLDSAVRTSNHKVTAYLHRLSFSREQIASARLLQGALALGRAANTKEVFESQRLDQEALDHFRAVLELPNHKNDLAARELIAHQLSRLDGQAQLAENTYQSIVDELEPAPETHDRNRVLARAKRGLAILLYPDTPTHVLNLLIEAADHLVQFGPPRDREFLELAETVHLEAIVRLRLGHLVLGPQRLSNAQGHYRSLLRSLKSRRHGVFRWMFRERRFAGHRVAELQMRVALGLAQVDHLIRLYQRHPALLISSLRTGNGAPRRNRKLLSLP